MSQVPSSPGLDMTHWPVMIVDNTAAEGDDALRVQFEALGRVYREYPEPYINVIDARNGTMPTAGQRKMISDFGAKYEGHEKIYCKGKAFVFTNPLIRGIMTAIQWMRNSTVETQVFSTIPEAVAWGNEQLARHGTGASLSSNY